MAVKFDDIIKQIGVSINKFNNRIPEIQKQIFEKVQRSLKELELTDNDQIKPTIKNLLVIRDTRESILKIILTDDYKEELKEFRHVFNLLEHLQHEFWSEIQQQHFKPKKILTEIKNQTVTDVVNKLTDAGMSANIGDKITDMLRTNVTSGGSYSALIEQLRESLTTTQTPGLLDRYVRQVTVDSVNQFNAQYTRTISSDLGYEWFKYDNTDIDTTRPFCDAMTDRPYFHISEIPSLLRAEGLTYVNKKTGRREAVPIYVKTGLPHGMIPGTNESSFFVLRGGYNCGHQIRPVNVRQVPQEAVDRAKATPAYIRWTKSETAATPPEMAQQKDVQELMSRAKQAGPEIDQVARDIADKYGAKVTPINYKSRESITRKVNSEYGGNVSKVKDAVRNTIIAPRGRIEAIVTELGRNSSVISVKRQSGANFLGYSGTVISYRAANGLIGEIQVNTPKMIYAKEPFAKQLIGEKVFDRIRRETQLEAGLGHKYYEEYRVLPHDNLTPEQLKRKLEIEKLSDEYYSHFRN